MKKVASDEQIIRLRKAVIQSIDSNGASRVVQCHNACLTLLHWIKHLRKSETTGCCDEMLLGLQAAAVEVAGYLALGLVRPAIFAMRGEIDLALAWLFYRGHPVEWQHVLHTGEGFKLKGDIFDFLAK